MQAIFDPGSFRDPAGRVVNYDGRIFRAISAQKASDADTVLDAPFFRKRMDAGDIVQTWRASPADNEKLNDALPGYATFHEHQKIATISYPYEWPFSLLKRAAILHLEVHLEALENGFDLSDSSAYNVQFVGSRPVFMDTLSFRRYEDGAYWTGYKQFCEQFLAPLLISSYNGIGYGDWYRGSINGLPLDAVAKVLSSRARLSLQAQIHIYMHARLMGKISSHDDSAYRKKKALPLASLKGILQGMLRYVRSLTPAGLSNTYWKEYEFKNSYSAEDSGRKRDAVASFCARYQPNLLLDIGCNSGDFSELALASGVERVVGVDFDRGALEAAVSRADEKALHLLPLYQDLTNPSSSLGWANRERPAFADRVQADAAISLAVIHHLVIGKNIDLKDATTWMVERAKCGIIEFVPKKDPMVAGMLRHRDEVFAEYTEENFRNILSRIATITEEVQSSQSGRRIFIYER